MKKLTRLIKKANIDYDDFLYNLLSLNEYSNEEVEQIINDNPDCLYNGIAYRIFFFDEYTVKELGTQLVESVNNDIDELTELVIKNLIDANGLYHSFSKSLKGIEVVEKDVFIPDTLKVVIKMNVENGLDIEKLFNKHKNELSKDVLNNYSKFKSEEEVLAKLTNNYDIIENDDIYYCLYELINGDPSEDY